MTLDYFPQGVCSRQMRVTAEDGIITKIDIIGGCDGNLQGLSRLLPGMQIEDAIERMTGIMCGGKNTSCPDQLAKALTKLKLKDNDNKKEVT